MSESTEETEEETEDFPTFSQTMEDLARRFHLARAKFGHLVAQDYVAKNNSRMFDLARNAYSHLRTAELAGMTDLEIATLQGVYEGRLTAAVHIELGVQYPDNIPLPDLMRRSKEMDAEIRTRFAEWAGDDEATANGAIKKLADKLSTLREHAGSPSLREIANGAGGEISHTTVADVLNGRRITSWSVIAAIVRSLGGNEEDFRAAWFDAQSKPDSRS